MAFRDPPITQPMETQIVSNEWQQWFIDLYREAQIKSQSVTMDDISTANTVYIPIGFNGSIKEIYTTIDGVITGGDAVLTVKDKDSNTMGTITIANSGSAAGTEDSVTTLVNAAVTKGDHITISSDGGSTGTTVFYITILIDVS